MTPGLAFFYGGMVSETAVVNTMMLSFGSMGIVTVLCASRGARVAPPPNRPRRAPEILVAQRNRAPAPRARTLRRGAPF